MAECIGRNGSEQGKERIMDYPGSFRAVRGSQTIYPGQSRLHNIHDNVAFFLNRICSKRLLIGRLFHLLFDHNLRMIMRPEGPSAFGRTAREVNFSSYPKCEF